MQNIDKTQLSERISAMLPILNEYQKRIYLSTEASLLGAGGISLVSRISGMSKRIIRKGIQELTDKSHPVLPSGRIRREGGGRKSISETQPGIEDALEKIVSAHTKGDPMSSLLWTNKSLRVLAKELVEQGYKISHRIVGKLLKKLGYSLQANKKSLSLTKISPDRDAQFENINSQTAEAKKLGNPVISIDAKKKENIGNFKNNGRTYQEEKNPKLVLDHDFPIKELGKATPYGVYDIFKNQGFVNVGLSKDTAKFAVESIRKWWYQEGYKDYIDASEIVITADCGGSNGYRNRLWKHELQLLANEIGKSIRVLHYPPGTSKWNKIEHRLFSFISINWQGVPLISTAVILSLINATKTEHGLAVSCVIDESVYKNGIKVSDEDFDSINISYDDFHGEWNYTISPVSL
jgi:transposase